MSFISSKTRINIVGLRGVIGDLGRFQKGLTLENCASILDKAFSFKKPSVVVIKINSPGGSPVQSELIHNRIRNLSKKNNVKVITIAEDVAASGGYMLMCAGDILIANKSSIVGSIGVISASFGFKKLIDKLGIKRRVFTKGDRKSFLDPFEEVSKKDINEKERVVYTSGLGGLFKPGIPIGKMNISSNGIVNFFSDFTQLSYVKIVSYKFGGEE